MLRESVIFQHPFDIMETKPKAKLRLQPKFRRAHIPTTTALAKSVEFDDEMMHVSLTDGRMIGTLYLLQVLHCIDEFPG